MGVHFTHCDAYWTYLGYEQFIDQLSYTVVLAKTDPVWEFINQPDCCGELTPEQCSQIAPRIRLIVHSWANNDGNKHNALELARGMEAAASKHESLEFI